MGKLRHCRAQPIDGLRRRGLHLGPKGLHRGGILRVRDGARPSSRTTLRAKSTTSTVCNLRLIDVLLDTHARPLNAAARQFLSRRAAVDITLRLVDKSL